MSGASRRRWSVRGAVGRAVRAAATAGGTTEGQRLAEVAPVHRDPDSDEGDAGEHRYRPEPPPVAADERCGEGDDPGTDRHLTLPIALGTRTPTALRHPWGGIGEVAVGDQPDAGERDQDAEDDRDELETHGRGRCKNRGRALPAAPPYARGCAFR
jgi:hypothetical protein